MRPSFKKTADAEPNFCPLEELPPEVFSIVTGYLCPKDFASLSQTSKKMQKLCAQAFSIPPQISYPRIKAFRFLIPLLLNQLKFSEVTCQRILEANKSLDTINVSEASWISKQILFALKAQKTVPCTLGSKEGYLELAMKNAINNLEKMKDIDEEALKTLITSRLLGPLELNLLILFATENNHFELLDFIFKESIVFKAMRIDHQHYKTHGQWDYLHHWWKGNNTPLCNWLGWMSLADKDKSFLEKETIEGAIEDVLKDSDWMDSEEEEMGFVGYDGFNENYLKDPSIIEVATKAFKKAQKENSYEVGKIRQDVYLAIRAKEERGEGPQVAEEKLEEKLMDIGYEQLREIDTEFVLLGRHDLTSKISYSGLDETSSPYDCACKGLEHCLIQASKKGHTECAKLLINQLHFYQQSQSILKALALAVECGHEKIVEYCFQILSDNEEIKNKIPHFLRLAAAKDFDSLAEVIIKSSYFRPEAHAYFLFLFLARSAASKNLPRFTKWVNIFKNYTHLLREKNPQTTQLVRACDHFCEKFGEERLDKVFVETLMNASFFNGRLGRKILCGAIKKNNKELIDLLWNQPRVRSLYATELDQDEEEPKKDLFVRREPLLVCARVGDLGVFETLLKSKSLGIADESHFEQVYQVAESCAHIDIISRLISLPHFKNLKISCFVDSLKKSIEGISPEITKLLIQSPLFSKLSDSQVEEIFQGAIIDDEIAGLVQSLRPHLSLNKFQEIDLQTTLNEISGTFWFLP